MEAKYEAKFRMYRTVENYCEINNALISTNAALLTAFNDFKGKIVLINAAFQQSGQVITGITADKNVAKQKLCEMTAEIAGVIFAYASTVGGNTLKNQVDFPYSDLMKTREDALAPRCQNIHNAGEVNLSALADYGITQAKLDDLQTAINNYAAQTPKSRTAISERKAVNAAIIRLLDETDEILKNRMDRLVQTFKTSNPDFVKTYESDRRIVKPPTTVTQLKGTITDQTTGAPIPNAQIIAAPSDPEFPPLTTISDISGEYSFKPIAHGICNLSITASGYQTFQTQTDVMMGEINDVDVELEK